MTGVHPAEQRLRQPVDHFRPEARAEELGDRDVGVVQRPSRLVAGALEAVVGQHARTRPGRPGPAVRRAGCAAAGGARRASTAARTRRPGARGRSRAPRRGRPPRAGARASTPRRRRPPRPRPWPAAACRRRWSTPRAPAPTGPAATRSRAAVRPARPPPTTTTSGRTSGRDSGTPPLSHLRERPSGAVPRTYAEPVPSAPFVVPPLLLIAVLVVSGVAKLRVPADTASVFDKLRAAGLPGHAAGASPAAVRRARPRGDAAAPPRRLVRRGHHALAGPVLGLPGRGRACPGVRLPDHLWLLRQARSRLDHPADRGTQRGAARPWPRSPGSTPGAARASCSG